MVPHLSTDQNSDPHLLPRHSIAVVALRTGLTQLVLRAWERRYATVTPSRTPTGRRLYTDYDVQKLTLLKFLTDNGHRIGDVAHLPLKGLQELYEESGNTFQNESKNDPQQPIDVTVLRAEAMAAVKNLDPHALKAVLNKALVELSKPDLRRELLVPLMVEVGDLWQDGQLRVSHEHMATGIVFAFLNSINSRYRVALGSPLLAVATPAGNTHELGALLAASTAYEAGWDVLYLGSDLPAEDIAAAINARGAKAVLLSLVFPHGDSRTVTELRELHNLLSPDFPILVGGQAAPSYSMVLSEIGALSFSTVEGLDEALRHI